MADTLRKAFRITYGDFGSGDTGYYTQFDESDVISVTALDPHDALESANRGCNAQYEVVMVEVFCVNGGTTTSCGSPGNHHGYAAALVLVETCEQECRCGGGGPNGGSYNPGDGGGGGGGVGLPGTSPVTSDHVKFEAFKQGLGRDAVALIDNDLLLSASAFDLLKNLHFDLGTQDRLSELLERMAEPDPSFPVANGLSDLVEIDRASLERVLDYYIAIPAITTEEAVMLVNIELLTGEALAEGMPLWLLDNPGFAEEAINAMENDGELSFNALVIEEKIEDENLDPCSKGILDELKTLQQFDIAKVLSRFGDVDSTYDWEIKTGIPTESNNVFETDWVRNNGVPTTYNYLTLVNPSYINSATDLAIARTVLHEAVHAYILSYIDDFLEDPNTNQQIFQNNFANLWNYFVAKSNNIEVGDIEDAHHEEMAETFVYSIGDALAEYDNNQQNEDYYRYLAWGSLFETDAWATASSFYDHEVDPYSVINAIIIANHQEDTNGLDAHGEPCP